MFSNCLTCKIEDDFKNDFDFEMILILIWFSISVIESDLIYDFPNHCFKVIWFWFSKSLNFMILPISVYLWNLKNVLNYIILYPLQSPLRLRMEPRKIRISWRRIFLWCYRRIFGPAAPQIWMFVTIGYFCWRHWGRV